jgi:hypothetical protein
MNMIRHAAHAVAFAIGISCDSGEIGVKGWTHRCVEHGSAVFRAENQVDEQEGE